MIHEQDICPVCAQQFTDADDVVYCPECGTPHHRACWQEHGGCANAHLHAQGYVWQSSAPDADAPQSASDRKTVCPRCGEACKPDTLVCPSCGKRFGIFERDASERRQGGLDFNADFFMRGVQDDPASDLDGVTVRETAMYTQYRAADYVRKFREKKKIGWNWAAFFFSPFWFFYRKVYRGGALFLGLLMVLGIFAAIPLSKVQDSAMQTVQEYITIDENSSYEQITADLAALQGEPLKKVQDALMRYAEGTLAYIAVLFIPNFFAAMFADRMYKSKIVREIRSMHDFTDDERTFRMLVLRRGGVSVLGLIACYMLMSLFFNFVFYIR